MLFIVRVAFTFVYCILICILGILYCVLTLSPRHPKHMVIFSHIFAWLAPFLGLKIEKRLPKGVKNFSNAIYIANHQNNYDIVILSNIIFSNTIILGKKSLFWIPFFGQLYWITGNCLIDRNNTTRAYKTILKIIDYCKKYQASIWIFPEGTRNRGQGLLPFKTGAFYAAIIANIPIIPVCISNTSNKINLNRFNNGLVIVEMLPAIDVSNYNKNQLHELAAYCHTLMAKKILELDQEVAKREKII